MKSTIERQACLLADMQFHGFDAMWYYDKPRAFHKRYLHPVNLYAFLDTDIPSLWEHIREAGIEPVDVAELVNAGYLLRYEDLQARKKTLLLRGYKFFFSRAGAELYIASDLYHARIEKEAKRVANLEDEDAVDDAVVKLGEALMAMYDKAGRKGIPEEAKALIRTEGKRLVNGYVDLVDADHGVTNNAIEKVYQGILLEMPYSITEQEEEDIFDTLERSVVTYVSELDPVVASMFGWQGDSDMTPEKKAQRDAVDKEVVKLGKALRKMYDKEGRKGISEQATALIRTEGKRLVDAHLALEPMVASEVIKSKIWDVSRGICKEMPSLTDEEKHAVWDTLRRAVLPFLFPSPEKKNKKGSKTRGEAST